MTLTYQGETVPVFTVSHRTNEMWKDIQQVVRLADRYKFDGVLFFEGNDVPISPWLAGSYAYSYAPGLRPIVALNPVFMHPFTAAKLVSGFAIMYGRRTYLNLITGTALSYLGALGAPLDHDERYLRLQEYAEIIRALFEAQGQPVTYRGQYYSLENAKLEVPVVKELHPEFFIAGQSEFAIRTAKAIGAVHMLMLPSTLAAGLPEGTQGVHMGLLSRDTEEEAWAAGERAFPADVRGQRMQAMSMANTDGVWKKELYEAAKQPDGSKGYWLEPFRNFKADGPYFVGSHDQSAQLIASLVIKGIRRMIVDLPGPEENFQGVAKAFKAAQALLAS